MSKAQVICDKCQMLFKIKKLNKRSFTDGPKGKVTFYYFSCPDCKEKYISHIESEEIKKMIKERKQLQQQANEFLKANDPLGIAKAHNHWQKIERIDKEAKKLQAEYKLLFGMAMKSE